MINMDTWQFAQEYSGKLFWKIGWILLLISILLPFFVYGATSDSIAWLSLGLIAVQTIVLIASLFPVQRALKHTFTDDGKRR